MDVLEKKVPIPVKTYKDVEREIENQYLFAKGVSDHSAFREKGEFLSSMGFTNSISTKLYNELSTSRGLIDKYERAYNKRYKFILEAQLEFICEKYNLYVRGLNHFLGEIPKKNVEDLMGCWIVQSHATGMDDGDFLKKFYRYDYLDNIRHSVLKEVKLEHVRRNAYNQVELPVKFFEGQLSIAAVKNLFRENAFKDTQVRIINKSELEAKFHVELDPIVLCKVEGGYLILTAWGDESNDELVANHNFN